MMVRLNSDPELTLREQFLGHLNVFGSGVI